MQPLLNINELLLELKQAEAALKAQQAAVDALREAIGQHVEQTGAIDNDVASASITNPYATITYARKTVEEAQEMLRALAEQNKAARVVYDKLVSARQESTRAGSLRIKFK